MHLVELEQIVVPRLDLEALLRLAEVNEEWRGKLTERIEDERYEQELRLNEQDEMLTEAERSVRNELMNGRLVSTTFQTINWRRDFDCPYYVTIVSITVHFMIQTSLKISRIKRFESKRKEYPVISKTITEYVSASNRSERFLFHLFDLLPGSKLRFEFEPGERYQVGVPIAQVEIEYIY